MKRRVERKPHDPKMLVHMPHAAGAEALGLLRQTFGPHAPAAVQTLVTALGDAIARHATLVASRRKSRFASLPRERELTFDTPSPAHVHSIKASAHNWARYHGCLVATRSHPSGKAITVYLVQAPA